MQHQTQIGSPARTKAEYAAEIASQFAVFERFAGLLKIQPKEGGGRIPLRLSPVQRAYCAARTARDIILKPRQVHMTTCEAARDLWWFLTKRGARVVVVVQSLSDGAPLKDVAYKFRVFFDSLRHLGIALTFGTDSTTEWSIPDRDATLRIMQAGASEASASKKGRAGTVNRLHISEAAFFEHADETFNALMESVPMTGSEVVIESTAHGAHGFFYEQWQKARHGDSVYRPHFFPWWLHPDYRLALGSGEQFEPRSDLEISLAKKGISAERLNWYRAKLLEKGGDAARMGQEFPSDPETCFLVSGRGFFDGARLAAQLRDVRPPIESINYRAAGARDNIVADRVVPAVRIWHRAERGKEYVIALDTSEGSGGDAGAGICVERGGAGRHMATIWGQFKPWELARVAVWLANTHYKGAVIAPERNNHGHACLRALDAEQHYRQIFVDLDGKPGWLTGVASRATALDAFEQAHRQGVFDTHDEFLLAEMRTFVIGPTGKAEAAKGKYDDLVMAAAIGRDVICRARVRRGLSLLNY
jgi:hypothetical protein